MMPQDEADPAHLREVEQYLHTQIPLSQAMAVRVESLTADALTLTAPLAPNHNHLGTAFGGSLVTLATLAGYAWLWLHLDDRQSHVVVKESTVRYKHPVTGDLRAVCRGPDQTDMGEFRTLLSRSGKARVTLPVTLEEAGRVCVEFLGEFVAIR